jgi:phosphohistidine phosphatase
MSKQIWFLRHGEAEPHGSGPDAERALTATGEHQSELAGKALARLGCEFDAVFTSPKLRASQTAELACAALGVEPSVHEELAEGFDAREALALSEGMDKLLLVGHEPDFSQCVRDLTGGRVKLKKGGIAVVALRGSSGELLVLLRPKEAETLARD